MQESAVTILGYNDHLMAIVIAIQPKK